MKRLLSSAAILGLLLSMVQTGAEAQVFVPNGCNAQTTTLNGVTYTPITCPTPVPAATATPTIAPTAIPTVKPTAIPTASPSPVVSAAPLFTAQIADIAAYGFDVVGPIFAGFTNLPVTTTTAKITGNPVVGATVQIFGTFNSATGAVTATSVIVTVSPTAVPTVAATAAPTASGNLVMVNGHYWTGGTVFPLSKVWSSPIPANPKVLANSATIVAAQFPNAVNASGSNIHGQEAGQYDYGHVVYYAKTTDPQISWTCNQYCNAPDNGGVPKTFYVPAQARPAGGSDAHMVSIQPDGTEIDMWACYGGIPTGSGVWKTGSTITCGNVSNAGNIYTGSGQFTTGPGADAMNSALTAGQITPAELISGQINHAIFVTGLCAVGAQYPSPPGSGTGTCTSGVGPPLGGRYQYTVPCATTQASTVLKPWEKAILCALNVYGGYMGDDGGGGANFVGLGVGVAENAEAGYQFGLITSAGVGDDMAGMSPQGWSPISIPSTLTTLRWYSNDIDSTGQWIPTGVNFKANSRWLDPCVTLQSC